MAKNGTALTTNNGNLLVNLSGSFFYMSPKGEYLPSKYEKDTGNSLKSQEWDWLKKSSGQIPQRLNDEQQILAQVAYQKAVDFRLKNIA